MSLTALLTKIEEVDFAACTRTASTVADFVSTVRAQQHFAALVQLLRKERAVAVALLGRIRAIVYKTIDLRYENPFDTALAAYLIAIEQAVPHLAGLAAELVMTAKQTWLSSQIGRSLLLSRKSAPIEATGQQVILVSSGFNRRQQRKGHPSDSDILIVSYINEERAFADCPAVSAAKPVGISVEEITWKNQGFTVTGRATANNENRTLN